MQQMAYDHLSIPAISSEIERVFRAIKLNLGYPRGLRVYTEMVESWAIPVQPLANDL